jgi:uncharacterized protein
MVMDFVSAKTYALERLTQELPGYYTYHCLEHTRDDVVVAASSFARYHNVVDDDLTRLLTGAYFHDLGFVVRANEHEQISVAIARQVLPSFGYTAYDLDIIEGIIMATRMPQSPQTLLEAILADADMDSLGRMDFFDMAERLRREMAALGKPLTDEEWYEFEIDFLANHTYFTEAGRAFRKAQKDYNLQQLYHRMNHDIAV